MQEPAGLGLNAASAIVANLPDGGRLAPEHDPPSPVGEDKRATRAVFPVALPHVFRAEMNERELVDLRTTLVSGAGTRRVDLISAESVDIGVWGTRAEWRLIEPELGTEERVRAVFAATRGQLRGAIFRADAAGAWAQWPGDAEYTPASFRIVPDPTLLERAVP